MTVDGVLCREGGRFVRWTLAEMLFSLLAPSKGWAGIELLHLSETRRAAWKSGGLYGDVVLSLFLLRELEDRAPLTNARWMTGQLLADCDGLLLIFASARRRG